MDWRPLQRRCARPVRRLPKEPTVRYPSFMHRAGSWDRERRVVPNVERDQGELLARVGFIITNLPWRCRASCSQRSRRRRLFDLERSRGFGVTPPPDTLDSASSQGRTRLFAFQQINARVIWVTRRARPSRHRRDGK